MPQVVISARALADIRRLRNFLEPKDANAAQRAAKAIIACVRSLADFPLRGKEAQWLGVGMREMVIPFGNSGYVAAYHAEGEMVTILGVRHQKEAGY